MNLEKRTKLSEEMWENKDMKGRKYIKKPILGKDPMSVIAEHYKVNYKQSSDADLAAYPNYPDKIESWVRGLHSTPKGYQTGHTHQNRILKDKKQEAINALSTVSCPSDITDFDRLFEWVYGVLHGKGVINGRSVWVYDIALRIGQCMNPKIEPEKFVYLYNGAYEGAVALNKHLPKGSKIQIEDHRAPITSFPPELQEFGAIDLENIMCDYHPKKKKKMK